MESSGSNTRPNRSLHVESQVKRLDMSVNRSPPSRAQLRPLAKPRNWVDPLGTNTKKPP